MSVKSLILFVREMHIAMLLFLVTDHSSSVLLESDSFTMSNQNGLMEKHLEWLAFSHDIPI